MEKYYQNFNHQQQHGLDNVYSAKITESIKGPSYFKTF